ncbi:MAG: hypothetical protein AAF901_08045 [Bacteroidota bacterium]
MNLQNEILEITSEYLQETIDYQKLFNTSKAYKTFLSDLSDQEFDTKTGRDDIHFENGKAIGALWAVMCIDDIMRTRQFIRGIDKAIEEKLNTHTSIDILYAGTGPFATLLLPLMLRYPKEHINYTFMEINRLSLNTLKRVISTLGMDDYNITFLQEDASQYKLTGSLPDIIVSETMQNALANEQQVPIFLNLMRQAKSDTVFIPEKIEISLGLKRADISFENLQREDYHKAEKIFEVSRDALIINNSDTPSTEFQKTTTVLSEEQLEGHERLMLFTEIQVYQDEVIRLNESGLTIPLPIKSIPRHAGHSLTVNTQYKIGSTPKLVYTFA